MDDAARWDVIHQRTVKESGSHSVYAQEKEILFPRQAVVCDLGGGTGEDALYFLKMGHSVILFDISEFALKTAEKKAKDAGVVEKLVIRRVDFGLHKLPLKEGSLDVAYSRISLNYFPKEETVSIFRSIYGSLKTGGFAYLTFKSPDDVEEMEYLKNNAVVYESGVYIEGGQLRSRFTSEEIKEMLSDAGITNIDVHPYKEAIGESKEGHQKILYVNEIIFQKT